MPHWLDRSDHQQRQNSPLINRREVSMDWTDCLMYCDWLCEENNCDANWMAVASVTSRQTYYSWQSISHTILWTNVRGIRSATAKSFCRVGSASHSRTKNKRHGSTSNTYTKFNLSLSRSQTRSGYLCTSRSKSRRNDSRLETWTGLTG